SWIERANRQALLSDILDLSELFHPDTFLNALRQETARSIGCSMDSLVFLSSWRSPVAQAKIQVKVGGLQLEGCRFDGVHLSENQHDSPSVSAVPACHMAWAPQLPSDFSLNSSRPQSEPQENIDFRHHPWKWTIQIFLESSTADSTDSEESIWLPLYTSSERVKLVTHVSLPCGANPNQWIQAGAALFLKQQ
ncbi:hypothetical protein ATANTOWER_006838, partial [Ataeniobius toweri]|nr:hypothetical protein [Ataeniobius toweri]